VAITQIPAHRHHEDLLPMLSHRRYQIRLSQWQRRYSREFRLQMMSNWCYPLTAAATTANEPDEDFIF
jgi:hypothetical protein